jgi:hypothetical protein
MTFASQEALAGDYTPSPGSRPQQAGRAFSPTEADQASMPMDRKALRQINCFTRPGLVASI